MKLLFKTEFVALTELVEVLTPMIYVIWLVLLRQSDNLQYYRHLRDYSEEQFVSSLGNIGIVILLQTLSFVCLIVILKHRYGLPIEKQLTIALNKHKWLILATTCIWTSVALTGPLEHIGNDYTFAFLKSD